MDLKDRIESFRLSMRLALMRQILNHNISIILLSGAAAIFIAASLIGRACNAPPYKLFPKNPSEFLSERKINRQLEDIYPILEREPDNYAALCEMAVLKYQKGPDSYPEAIVALEKAKYGGHLDSRIFYYLGAMYQHEGLYSYAEAELRRFLYNSPDDYDASMILGLSLYSQKKYTEAADLYLSMLQMHKKDRLLLSNLAFAQNKTGNDYSETLNMLKKTGSVGRYISMLTEGEILFENSKYSESLEILEEARKMKKYSGKDFKLHILIAKNLAETGKNAECRANLAEIEKMFPGKKETQTLLERLDKQERQKKKEQSQRQSKQKSSRKRK